MAETPKAPPSAFRQDLLRGIRWGAILLIVMLLSITAYRVLSSSPAAASQPKVAEELAPASAPDVAPAAATPIQVGEAVLKGPDAPAVPELPKTRKTAPKAAPKAAPQVAGPPERLHAPPFPSAPVAAPKPAQSAFVADPLPTPAPTPAPVVEVAVPGAIPAAAPPVTPAAADNGKQGNRATRAVRSVGRIFGIGRKNPQSESKAEPTKR